MKKSIVIGVSVVTGLVMCSFMPSSFLSIKLHNPCSDKITFSQSISPNGVLSTQGVSSGNTISWSVEEGRYINYKLPGENYVSLGKVESKGQVFTCHCK